MNPLTVIAPTILTIFGITGDLSQRKLFPALLDLYGKGLLPKDFRIIGVGRRPWVDADLKQFVAEALAKKNHKHAAATVEAFIELFTYCQGDFTAAETYEVIKNKLADIDNQFKTCSNKLFHLAVPPDYYEEILRKLGKFDIHLACGGGAGWSRILIEKPFGRDLVTAQKLDALLGELFTEKQIFRIDHYLGKEAIQDIMKFRFSEGRFEEKWNHQYVDKVFLRLHESLGVENRGSFYNSIGALRDVGQNHLLQMLAIVAMENPDPLTPETIHQAREAVLRSLVPFTADTLAQNTVRAQYEGYAAENTVPENSTTETYFLLKTFINNDRWQGVPFYLESGKKMAAALTDITVYFKDSAEPPVHFQIHPTDAESIGLDAYEKILYDCILGDQTLFVSTKEVEAAWRFIMPIVEGWNSLPLLKYPDGSLGPNKQL